MAHWTDKRSARALVGHELRARGWELYGWKEDQSESMTDYYSPEDWDGVGEKVLPDGRKAVVCVDVGKYTTEKSGGRDRIRYDPGATCDRCNGTRVEPGSRTLQEDRADGSTLSPLPYFGGNPMYPDRDIPAELDGKKRCNGCNGRGHRLQEVIYREPWPTFQENPPHCSWHVEMDGLVLAQGTGVFSLADEEYKGENKPKVKALCDRIERALQNGTGVCRPRANQIRGAVDREPGIYPGRKPGYSEILFSCKPAEPVRSALKANGWRWAPSTGCWYGPTSSMPEEARLELGPTGQAEAEVSTHE